MASRILVIDDSRLVVVMIADNLAKNGYQVLTASDGLEGLRQVQKEKPDLIILDRHMPLMEGDQFMVELVKACGDATPPVILLTAGDPNSEPPRCAGVNCCLRKPVHAEELLVKINECLKTKE
jgi:DNA-binding response OmpR family regulator